MPVAGCFHGFLQREEDVDPASGVRPSVARREAHAVQQERVEHPRLKRNDVEPGILKQRFRNAIEEILFLVRSVKIIQIEFHGIISP